MNILWLPLLLSSVVWAEEQYFPQVPNATWDEARLFCQSCFRELTTITSRNVHLIAKNLSSDYWLGLRKSYNGSFPWAAWSNGDPVTYQNWYPGHPVPNKEKKLIPICSSTTESPLSTVITTTTAALMTSTVTSAPVTFTKTSTMFQTEKEENTCPILIDVLDCLNMTCYEFESVMTMCDRTMNVTPKTTTYNTTPEVTTFSTTFNATTTEDATTEGTTAEAVTTEGTTTESTTTSNCIFEPEPDPEQYIEDACVVLLSFGMWKEEDCNTSLPYICYEERFFGQIHVSDVNTSEVNLSWTEGPGAENISHYRVEITGGKNQTFNQTDLSEHMQNLTAGTLYRVQVFPVKCSRDLNPQNISFYTRPSDVQNLTVVGMTNDSATLKWSKPEGNRGFYSVHVKCKLNISRSSFDQKCPCEVCTINKLVPGYEYEFTVTAVVNESFGGVPSSVSDYTKPSTVRNLKQSEDKHSTVIKASWEAPDGGHSGYRYCLTEVQYNHTCACSTATSSNSTANSSVTTNNYVTNADITTGTSSTPHFITTTSSTSTASSFTTSSSSTTHNNLTVCKNTTEPNLTESDKSDGSKFCLCVQALTKNDTISGEMVAIPAYTLPKSVILFLTPDYQSINASWTIDGNYEKFELTIQTAPYTNAPVHFTHERYYKFSTLKAGVSYNISVVTINGNLRSQPTIKSDFTRPKSPENVKAKVTKTTIEVKWDPPAESMDASITYMVQYHTKFWNLSMQSNTTNTAITYTDLKPGTKYDFDVRVVAGNLTSDPVTVNASTEPRKRTLVLTMLCSSETPHHCNKADTRKELLEKLINEMNGTFHDWVHWKLKFADRP